MRIVLALIFAITTTASHADDPSTAVSLFLKNRYQSIYQPVIAEMQSQLSDTSFAIIFPADNIATLMVLNNAQSASMHVIAQSKAFGFYPNANFGATWINELVSKPKDKFSLELSYRGTCGPTVNKHHFALRRGLWMTVGLDKTTFKCTDDGIVRYRTSTENFLTGIIETIDFKNDKPQQTVRTASKRKPFPLTQFPPNTAEYSLLQ
jgi:hypothetical protein